MSLGQKFSILKQWTREKIGSVDRTPESEEHVAAEAQIKAARAHLESLRALSRNWLDSYRRSAEVFDALSTKISETFLRDASANTVVDCFYQYVQDQTASQRGTAVVYESAFVVGVGVILNTHLPEAEKLLDEANEKRLLFDAQRHEVRRLERSAESRLPEIDSAKEKREEIRIAYEQAEARFLDAANALNAAQAELMSTELPRFVESFSHMHRNGLRAGERFATSRSDISRVDRFYAAEEQKDTESSQCEQAEQAEQAGNERKSSSQPASDLNLDDVDD